LLGEAAGSASYQISLCLPDAEFAGSAAIEPLTGQIAFVWQAEPPGWCEGVVRAQLRTLFRERAFGYPRRVTRWRPAPARGSAE
jgi:hypothetical protein